MDGVQGVFMTVLEARNEAPALFAIPPRRAEMKKLLAKLVFGFRIWVPT
jgi:hypothetical protein